MFLVISCALCFWLLAEVDRRNEINTQTYLYENLFDVHRTFLDAYAYDEGVEEDKRVTAEIDFLNIFMTAHLYAEVHQASDVRNESPFIEDLVHREAAETYTFKDKTLSRQRLESFYTPDTLKNFELYVHQFKADYESWAFYHHLKVYKLCLYLLKFLLVVALSFGVSIFSLVALQRETARDLTL